MMRTFRTLGLAALLMGSGLSATAAHNDSVDSRGCWDGLDNWGGDCMSVSDSYWRDTTFYVKYKNSCSYRIYARFCNEKSDGGEDCGADGIRPGAIKTWYTYNANGRYNYNWIGSDNAGQDWNCSNW